MKWRIFTACWWNTTASVDGPLVKKFLWLWDMFWRCFQVLSAEGQLKETPEKRLGVSHRSIISWSCAARFMFVCSPSTCQWGSSLLSSDYHHSFLISQVFILCFLCWLVLGWLTLRHWIQMPFQGYYNSYGEFSFLRLGFWRLSVLIRWAALCLENKNVITEFRPWTLTEERVGCKGF